MQRQDFLNHNQHNNEDLPPIEESSLALPEPFDSDDEESPDINSVEILNTAKTNESTGTYIDAYRIKITYGNGEEIKGMIFADQIKKYTAYLDKKSRKLLAGKEDTDNEAEVNEVHDVQERRVSINIDEEERPTEINAEEVIGIETQEIMIGAVKPLQGFIHPFYKDKEQRTVEEEARRLLQLVAMLHSRWHYQQVYFTCSMNLKMANDVKKAYQKGKRLTHATNHYHPKNREAKLMMTVEKLLEKEFPQLRSFYIAPMSTCEEPGGEGEILEETTRSQLLAIQEKLDQGHAVFCLTDEASWNAEQPFSVIEEKLSFDKEDKITFSPALNQFTQETLINYQKMYPIPQAVLHSLQMEPYLCNAIKAVDQLNLAPAPAVKEENDIDVLYAALTDAHLLKAWPLQLNLPGGISIIYENTRFAAVTVRQKRALIQHLINERASLEGKHFIFTEEKSAPDDPVPLARKTECQQLAYKYAERIKKYLSYHLMSNKTSADLASEINRVKLAAILLNSLKKVYLPNIADEERFDTQDFFDIVDSAESYANELRDTHSTLLPVLNDLVWEASLLKKTNFLPEVGIVQQEEDKKRNAQLAEEIQKEALLDRERRLAFVEDRLQIDMLSENFDSDESSTGEISSSLFSCMFSKNRKFIHRFHRTKRDADKISILQGALIQEIERIYDSNQNILFHSKNQTVARIKAIKTDNLYQYWLILIAEFRGQGRSSSSIKTALQKTLDVLEAALPAPSSSCIRRFALHHAARLLEYVNQRERSLAYKFGLDYARIVTAKHIEKAGELAHAMLIAETPEALYRIVLEATHYRKTLFTRPQLSQEESDCMFKSPSCKGSDLVQILNNIEKNFIRTFRNEPLVERKPIDLLWQEAFGGNYLNKKFAFTTKPQDQLQKRCYEVAKEMRDGSPIKKAHQHARMCALADAALLSTYRQVLVRKIQEQIGGDYLEQTRRRFPVVYQAQFCLAMMDEVETKPKFSVFKQTIEAQLMPFFTENRSMTDLHETIQDLSNRLKTSKRTRFFAVSPLQKFLEDFKQKLEKFYPDLKKARITNKMS